jgi:predicted GNAT superfamily acetyltransferase
MRDEGLITIRELESFEEVHRVEELEQEVWGVNDRDITPSTHLIAAKEAGGILIGAFDGPMLAGFAYGFIGYEQGEMTLHSHMLAVKPAYRNRNLGARLKLAQRERALERGIRRITWTFDPLQSLNAHFNFDKLGVVSDKYKINFYGESTSSFLHQTGTDRLWVSWLLESRRVRDRIEGRSESDTFEIDELTPLIRLGEDGLPRTNDIDNLPAQRQVVIEIPANIDSLQRTKPGSALIWREATRWAFGQALAAGSLVEEFYRIEEHGRSSGAYLLSAGKKLTDVR